MNTGSDVRWTALVLTLVPLCINCVPWINLLGPSPYLWIGKNNYVMESVGLKRENACKALKMVLAKVSSTNKIDAPRLVSCCLLTLVIGMEWREEQCSGFLLSSPGLLLRNWPWASPLSFLGFHFLLCKTIFGTKPGFSTISIAQKWPWKLLQVFSFLF